MAPKEPALHLRKFDPRLHVALKARAAIEGVTLRELVEKISREYLTHVGQEIPDGGQGQDQ